MHIPRKGRWIKDYVQTVIVRGTNNFSNRICFILQQDNISGFAAIQDMLNIRIIKELIGPAIYDNGILPRRIYLDNRMSGFFVCTFDIFYIDIV